VNLQNKKNKETVEDPNEARIENAGEVFHKIEPSDKPQLSRIKGRGSTNVIYGCFIQIIEVNKELKKITL
jgi:hypothetical protein